MTIDVEAWRAGGAFFDFRGHQVFYRREGRGPTVLLVHGYPTSSWDWAPMWRGLVSRYDVIAADMLGFGFSSKPPGHRYSLVEQTDLQAALLERLGIRAFHALVHDYGVSVGQELLAREQDGDTNGLVSICFLNGGLFPEAHRPRPIQRLLASPLGPLVARFSTERTFTRSLSAVFGPRTQPSAEELHAFWELASRDDGMRALQALIGYMRERVERRDRWRRAIADYYGHMLAINGVLDPVSGAHMVDRLVEVRPDTEVVRLDVGHYPHVEAPDETLAAYAAWLDPIAATVPWRSA